MARGVRGSPKTGAGPQRVCRRISAMQCAWFWPTNVPYPSWQPSSHCEPQDRGSFAVRTAQRTRSLL